MTKDSVVVQGVRYASRSAFTLVELLLVVAILGVLATIVIYNTAGMGENARIQATRSSISAIRTAVNVYEITTTAFPDSLDQLTVGDPPPLRKDQLNDAWGTPFQYKKLTRTTFEIRSAGPDRQMGTDDDITD